jgi:hypothetical protein
MLGGTGNFAYRSSSPTTCSGVCPEAAAFHSDSGVMRQVCTYSGLFTSSANSSSASRPSS